MDTLKDLDALYLEHRITGASRPLRAFCEALYRRLLYVAGRLRGGADRAEAVVDLAIQSVASGWEGIPPHPLGSALLMDTVIKQATGASLQPSAAFPRIPPLYLTRQICNLFTGAERLVVELHLLHHLPTGIISACFDLKPERVEAIIGEAGELLSPEAQISTAKLPAILETLMNEIDKR